VDGRGSALPLAKEKSEMVPGMTERERLAADVQRLEWLADATLGPGRHSQPPGADVPSGSRYAVPLGLCRRGFAMVHGLHQRIRTIRPRPVWTLPDEAPGQELA
jgi:hypothetical protein